MNERLNAVDQANAFVVKVEDKWIDEQTKHISTMKTRAEKSNTTIAWNEFHSSETILFQELDRLTPPVENKAITKQNKRRFQ